MGKAKLSVKKEQDKKEIDPKLKSQRDTLANKIRKDLMEQLKQMKITGNHYKDLVEDYIKLWHIKNMLIDDIEERGVQVKYKNGQHQWGHKKNDSVTELTRVNNQMLKLLADLGLKASDLEIPEDDEEL